MKRRTLLCELLALTLLLCGCRSGTSNNKNAIKAVLDVKTSEYRMTSVKRGDIAMRESVRVSYFASESESLSFPVSGLYYESIDVEVGDSVRTGDQLAALERSAIDDEIIELNARKESLENEIGRTKSVLDLLEARGVSDDMKRPYEITVRNANNEVKVIDARLDELECERSDRIITAGIDGTVTFVREIANGEVSTKGKNVVSVTNLDSCAFSATLEHPEALNENEIYTVSIDGTMYELRLTSAESLGIAETAKNEKSSRTTVFFRNLTPSVDLANGASGKFYITIDDRNDVLYLPSSAVSEVDGQICVYVPDETGLASVKPVSVGLDTGSYIEILSGIDEGETVILFD